jgi:hypothetical protein
VTIFGFSPIDRLFTFGSFLVTAVAQMYAFILIENWLGYILGDFFTTHLVTLPHFKLVFFVDKVCATRSKWIK